MKSFTLFSLYLLFYTSLTAQLAIGTTPPNFSLEGVINKEDQTIKSLEDFRGELVVIDFWATWCTPCVGAIPDLNELHDRYSSQGVNFLSITDDSPEQLANFLERTEFKFWIGTDPKQDIIKAYDAMARPTYYILNRHGAIVFTGNTINQEILDEVIATDFYSSALIQKPMLADSLTNLYGSVTGGDDPLYTGAMAMKGNDDIFGYDKYYQFIIRPSIEGGLEYLASKTRTHVGVTLTGATLAEIISLLKDLPTNLRVKNSTQKQQTFDIIYWKPSPGIQSTREEILSTLLSSLNIQLDSTALESPVKLFTNEGSKAIRPTEINPGTNRTYFSLQQVAASLEEKSEIICVLAPEMHELLLPTDELNYSNFWSATEQELLAYLARQEIRVDETSRTVVVYELREVE
mgnify:FL=1